MKKSILILCVLLISAAAFADVIVQQDYEGVGLYSYKLEGDCNPQITERDDAEFATYNGLSISTLFEFNSESDTAIHYYAGFDTGFDSQGLTAMAVGGLSANLASVGPCVLELNAGLKMGASFGLTNDLYPTAQADIMLNVMKADRKGLYAGVGITNQFIDLTFPALFKDDYYIMNYAGLIFAAGYRF